MPGTSKNDCPKRSRGAELLEKVFTTSSFAVSKLERGVYEKLCGNACRRKNSVKEGEVV